MDTVRYYENTYERKTLRGALNLAKRLMKQDNPISFQRSEEEDDYADDVPAIEVDADSVTVRDMDPGEVVRGHMRAHITVTRPASKKAEYDFEVSELLRLDYVLSSETAVASNAGPVLVAFLTAREFYRR